MIISDKNRLAIYKGLSILEHRKRAKINKAMDKEKELREVIEDQITKNIRKRRELSKEQADKMQEIRENSAFKDLLNII